MFKQQLLLYLQLLLISAIASAQMESKINLEPISYVQSELLNPYYSPDLLFIEGEVFDIERTQKAMIRFNLQLPGQDESLIQSSFDTRGRFLLVLDRSKIRKPFSIKASRPGYEDSEIFQVEQQTDNLELRFFLSRKGNKKGKGSRLDEDPWGMMLFDLQGF
jgi:hypothetical protein